MSDLGTRHDSIPPVAPQPVVESPPPENAAPAESSPAESKPHDPEHDPLFPKPEDGSVNPAPHGTDGLHQRVVALETWGQEVVDFLHKLFPGHGAPGVPRETD